MASLRDYLNGQARQIAKSYGSDLLLGGTTQQELDFLSRAGFENSLSPNPLAFLAGISSANLSIQEGRKNSYDRNVQLSEIENQNAVTDANVAKANQETLLAREQTKYYGKLTEAQIDESRSRSGLNMANAGKVSVETDYIPREFDLKKSQVNATIDQGWENVRQGWTGLEIKNKEADSINRYREGSIENQSRGIDVQREGNFLSAKVATDNNYRDNASRKYGYDTQYAGDLIRSRDTNKDIDSRKDIAVLNAGIQRDKIISDAGVAGADRDARMNIAIMQDETDRARTDRQFPEVRRTNGFTFGQQNNAGATPPPPNSQKFAVPDSNVESLKIKTTYAPTETFFRSIPRALVSTQQFNNYIGEAATKFNIPADMLRAIMIVESQGGLNRNDSPTGVKGIMQVTGATAASLQKMYPAALSGLDYTTDRGSINFAAATLRDNLDRNGGDVAKAIVEYNKGGEVANSLDPVTGKTSNDEATQYVARYNAALDAIGASKGQKTSGVTSATVEVLGAKVDSSVVKSSIGIDPGVSNPLDTNSARLKRQKQIEERTKTLIADSPTDPLAVSVMSNAFDNDPNSELDGKKLRQTADTYRKTIEAAKNKFGNDSEKMKSLMAYSFSDNPLDDLADNETRKLATAIRGSVNAIREASGYYMSRYFKDYGKRPYNPWSMSNR